MAVLNDRIVLNNTTATLVLDANTTTTVTVRTSTNVVLLGNSAMTTTNGWPLYSNTEETYVLRRGDKLYAMTDPSTASGAINFIAVEA